ncbi:hypothetical protein [Sporosarcina sp. ITBMC105]
MEVTIGLISAIVGMSLGYVGFMRTRDKDVAGRATESAILSTKLDSISHGVEQIRLDQKSTEAQQASINGRLIGIEKDVQMTKDAIVTINERVDRVENK